MPTCARLLLTRASFATPPIFETWSTKIAETELGATWWRKKRDGKKASEPSTVANLTAKGLWQC